MAGRDGQDILEFLPLVGIERTIVEASLHGTDSIFNRRKEESFDFTAIVNCS